MRIGVFAKTFAGSDPAIVLKAAREAGFEAVQYNMACSGLDALPLEIAATTAQAARTAVVATGVAIEAISATYNMIHPDITARARGRQAFIAIAQSAAAMGTRILTVCTGSYDAEDQWRRHPGNDSEDAWTDMCREFEILLDIADRCDIRIGVEPELANVVSTSHRARRLLDTFPGSRLGIVLDAANLFEVADAPQRRTLLEEAVDLLGPAIILAHAKDRTADGRVAAAGTGVCDYPHYLEELRRAGFDGPLIAHGMSEAEAPAVARFLRGIVEVVQ